MDTITSTSLPSKAQFPMAREPGMPLSSFLAEDAPNSHSTAPALSMPSTTYSSLSLNTSPPPSVVPQTMGNFTGSTPGSPSPMPQQSSSAPIHQSPPLSSSTSSAATKKPAIGSLDDSQIYHAHIENERVLEYDPTGKYGKGAYKVVWKALDFKDGYEVAWNSFQTSKQESTEFSQEIEILKQVRHPNIITFRDAWYNNGEFVFITELITSGTLREYIQKLKKPDLNIVRSWTRQILNGLLYLHSHNPPIIHRDIKCDNIFINGAHGEVKIGDMGTAKMKVGKKYTVIGTPEFMAPEMYDERGYSEKVDVYAFGMCLLEMVTAEYPYSECKNAAQIYKKVSSGIKPECLSRVTNEIVLSLIQKCIVKESERISVREILEHPFFTCEPELVLLSVDELRSTITLQVILRNPECTSFRFEYDLKSDSVESVVSEMIDEQIIPELYRSHLTILLNRQIRNFHQSFPFAMEIASARKIKQRDSEQAMSVVSRPQQDQELTSLSTTGGGVSQDASLASATQSTLSPSIRNISQTAITSPIFFPSTMDTISAQFSSSSLQSHSLLNWKRESQYKEELTNAQREMILAVERALLAEKRALEVEKLMKITENKRTETDLVIENLKTQIKGLKDQIEHSSLASTMISSSTSAPAQSYTSQQKSPIPLEDAKRYQISNTVLEQSYVPSMLITGGGIFQGTSPPKRPNSPAVTSTVTVGNLENCGLTPSTIESPVLQSSTFQQQQQAPLSQAQPPQHFISQQIPNIPTSAATPPPVSSTSFGIYPPDNMSIEDLVSEVALSSQRSPDKAYEWAVKLQMQDILTVGDLRQLHDTDWANLNLTVFAMRALKNAVSRRPSLGASKNIPSTASTPMAPTPSSSQQQPSSSNNNGSLGYSIDSDIPLQHGDGVGHLHPTLGELSFCNHEEAYAENHEEPPSSTIRHDGNYVASHVSSSGSDIDDSTLTDLLSTALTVRPAFDYQDDYPSNNYSFE